MKFIPVITIDGPSGSGKGTVASLLAKALNWDLLDSGALYRVLAFAVNKHQVNTDDLAYLEQFAAQLDVHFVPAQSGQEQQIVYEGEDVNLLIRNEQVGTNASKLAVIPEVRAGLLQLQKDFRRLPGLIADGRDMGTVVFPDAPLKVFLTASAEERARRRYLQLKEKGADVNLANLLHDIRARDERDTNRSIAPLKAAEDAIVLDSTTMTIDQVVERILNEVASRALYSE
ncbi:(d)CMP kinase [Pseudomonas sp. F1_0610]|uniref:(d)CMP kinase n=1 Tax=Pseudomonas sp. F1_0610 TaxID=3114284 RepID=UPI0039C02042